MVVVLVGALLGGCQLSLQLLDFVAVRQQLIVVAVNLAGPVAKSTHVSDLSQALLLGVLTIVGQPLCQQVVSDADEALGLRASALSSAPQLLLGIRTLR